MSREFEIYTGPVGKERDRVIIKTRQQCEGLLDRYGKEEMGESRVFATVERLKRALTGQHSIPQPGSIKSFSIPVKIVDEERVINISSSSNDPKTSEFIRIKVDKTIEELLLSSEDALIFEDWGMGENIYEKEIIEEHDGPQVREYTNPRLAPLEEIEPYAFTIDQIVLDKPLK